jgi:hypothetical protein
MLFVYDTSHETERERSGVRGSAAMGGISSEERPLASRGVAADGVFAVFRGPLEGSSKEQRDGGAGGEA